MPVNIKTIQQNISVLPEHILAMDLLVFRRYEQQSPTPWSQLAEYCVLLLSAVEQLRADEIVKNEPLNLITLTSNRVTTEDRLDTIGSTQLVEILGSSSDSIDVKAHPESLSGNDSALFKTLACLIEERLSDLLLEIAFALRRQRRLPRKPIEQNPMAQSLWNAKRALAPGTANLYIALANQIGPVGYDSFVKSASGAKV